MALSKKTQAAAAQATDTKFEEMEAGTETAVMDKPADVLAGAVLDNAESAPASTTHLEPGSEADAAADTREATRPSAEAVKEATTTAVAIAKEKGALAVSKKFVGHLSDKENVFEPGSLDFNTFPRVTVGLDGFSDDTGRDLGKTIKIEVMSYNARFVASPGTDDEAAKKHVRYSLDGKTIDSSGDDNGMSVQAYIGELKELHGYKDAALKEYQTIYGFLTYANDADIAPEDFEIVALQVPPQSRALFTRHQVTHGIKVQRGTVEASDIVVCRQSKQKGGNKTFALINFDAK